MPSITMKNFQGMRPAVSERLLPDNFAQIAQNCKFVGGELRAFNVPLAVGTPSKAGSGTVLSLYLFNDAQWFNWLTDVNAVPGPIAGDTQHRTYFTGNGAPKVTDATVGAGGPDYPTVAYDLGIPVPTAVPVASVATVSGTITSMKVQNKGNITGATQANPVVITSVGHGLTTGEDLRLTNVGGMTQINDNTSPFSITVIDANHFSLDGVDGTGYGAYTGGGYWYTPYKPRLVEVTATAHGRATGDRVTLDQVAGMAEVNENSYLITVVDANTFTLDGSNGTTYSDYISGGTWEKSYDLSQVESRLYVLTYVSAWGEEGPPGSASVEVECGPDQQVNLIGLGTAPAGNYNITLKRLYRSNQNSFGTAEYQFVAEMAVTAATYNDTVASDNLGETLQSTKWDAPPSTMHSLCINAGGVAAGIVGKDVYLSEPYQPHAYPTDYIKAMDYDGVGMVAVGRSFVVGTTGRPYLLYGDLPETMQKLPLDIQQACVSKRGMVGLPAYALYPCPDGLMLVGVGRQELVTEGIIDKDAWQAYVPTSIHAYAWKGKYVAFYDTGSVQGGFIFDPEVKSLTTIETHATAGYTHPKTGDLYLVVAGSIVKWDAGVTKMTYTWRSKIFEAPKSFEMALGRLVADGYPVTVKQYAAGSLRSTVAVADDEPFWFAGGYEERDVYAELIGTQTVSELHLADNMDDLP